MRLFIAIRFCPSVTKALLYCMEQLKEQSLSASLTRPENLHLTLAFIGETNRTAAVMQAMEAVGHMPPFELCLGDAGRFAGLWWVGVEHSQPLTAAAHCLQQSLRRSGFPIELRRFQPHITIARRVALTGPIHFEIPRVSMTVDRFSLMSSYRCGGRLIYTEVERTVLHPSPKNSGQKPLQSFQLP